jgi:Flp pilus assembly protein TadD
LTRAGAFAGALGVLILGCSTIESARLYRDGTRALEDGGSGARRPLARARRRASADVSEVQNHLGIAYLASGRRDEALRAFERAVALDCDNAAARRNLALLQGDPRAP